MEWGCSAGMAGCGFGDWGSPEFVGGMQDFVQPSIVGVSDHNGHFEPGIPHNGHISSDPVHDIRIGTGEGIISIPMPSAHNDFHCGAEYEHNANETHLSIGCKDELVINHH